MSKKLFLLLISFMSLCLLGIIFVQVYWIKNSFENKEDQFNYNVRQSLIATSSDLQKQELDYYFRLYSEVADSIGKPDTSTFREIVYTNTDNITNETFVYSSGLLEEDFKLSSNFLDMGIDSINFRKFTSRKFSAVIKPGIDDNSYKREYSEVATRNLDDLSNFQLRETFKDIAKQTPIHKRVNTEDIERLIKHQLESRDLNLDFEFAIFSKGLSTKVASEEFVYEKDSPDIYSVPLFIDENRSFKYELLVSFTKKQRFVFSSVLSMGVLTLFLTTIIILAYYSAIKQLIRQRQISEIKTDFINNMTHEFKTPIATINLALDAMKNPMISENKETMQRYLKMIREENKRMHAQVENVLRISKLEKRDLNIKKERLKLHELIEDAMTHVQLLVEDRGGYIKTHFDAQKSSILANESHFTNVIVNILDNAIKYSPNAPKIDIFTENVKNSIILKIQDQGSGMSKVAQKRIFEKFYREHTGNIHNVKGHGLGLSYVKRIIDDHQGQIFVESEKGKGSTFIIKLQLIS
ncbi:MAG: HAMP domain-containing histidine kinase [Flavobacteriaceae bacterium]|nr:HAMP domain-containing histidine kinase [Flavobacteriaceae bacterium]